MIAYKFLDLLEAKAKPLNIVSTKQLLSRAMLLSVSIFHFRNYKANSWHADYDCTHWKCITAMHALMGAHIVLRENLAAWLQYVFFCFIILYRWLILLYWLNPYSFKHTLVLRLLEYTSTCQDPCFCKYVDDDRRDRRDESIR